MNETVHSGGRSPKQSNGPSSTQNFKDGSDNLHNSETSFASQVKGKRRDRGGNQASEPIKRECTSKPDDGDSNGCKYDNNLIKSELSKMSEKGALITTDAVEKLVQLMQVDKSKKIDLTGRVLMADVIAATDSIDCLDKFMQVGGVTVLDEWLQEAHKGKTGNSYSPKEGDKAVEELLLALLRALDKLPINLHALQICNIGKSVNHLRSHKNLEIHRKARSLVDTWKRRVDAEMKMSDAKPAGGDSQTVTWQVKPGFSEVSRAGNRRNRSGELSMKSSITQQSISKGLSGKSVRSDSAKSTTMIAGSGKLPSSSKEEKSSCSSQSQNNSQSCSSDHGKTVGSFFKEDARTSTAASASKNSCASSRNQRSSNKPGNVSGQLNESNSGKLVSHIRNTVSERTVDASPSEHGSCHRLIVRIPNPGRSPTRSTSGGSLGDPSAGSRTSSPGVLDKHEREDQKVIGRNDSDQTHVIADVNAESWQSNYVKEGPDEEQMDEPEKVLETPKTMCSLSGDEKFTCVAESRMMDSLSKDDICMPKSNVVSPASSPKGSLPTEDPSCSGTNEAKAQNLSPYDENTGSDSLKLGKNVVFASGEDNKVVEEIRLYSDVKEESYREDANLNKGDRTIGGLVADGLTDCKSVVSIPVDQIKTFSSSSPTEASKFTSDSGRDFEKLVIAESSSCPHFNKDLPVGAIATEQKSDSIAKDETEVVERKVDGAPISSVANKAPCLENADSLDSKKFGGLDDQCLEQSERNGSDILSSDLNAHCESALSPGGMANGSDDHDQHPTMHGVAEACSKISPDHGERKDELTCPVEISSSVKTSGQDVGANKCNFDLNEGMLGDNVNQSELIFSFAHTDCSPAIGISSSSPLPSSPVVNGSPALTFSATAEVSLSSHEIMPKNKGDLGLKGSAPTSAFHPAEQARPRLDIDLNVPDERALEDIASLGGLDFDLNSVDEGAEDCKFVESTRCHFDIPSLYLRPPTIGFPNRDADMLRNFDLNSGPGIDVVGTEPLFRNQNAKMSNNMAFVPPNAHIRMNNTELGSGCFPPFNSYPVHAPQSFMNDREQSYPAVAASGGGQRILGPITSAGTFGSDMYRGPVLSSFPAMPYSPGSTTFSYPGFPFGTSFPLASSSFAPAGSTNFVDSSSGGFSHLPHIPLLGGAMGAVSSPYIRPSVIGHPQGIAALGSDSRKRARQGLDLNAGPGFAEEVKENRLPLSRQLHAAGSQSFMEEQARQSHVAGGVLKRKETDGGWEPEKYTFKHPSWR